jgi:IclR family pca regulon transcriptional regulator
MRTVKPGPAGAVKGNAATGNEGSDHGEVAGGDTGKPPGRAEGMAGLAKGLAILEAFRQRRGHLTITDAAGAVGVSRATARRCLLTLVALGYLAHDGKYFRPTPRMLWLGSAYVEGASLPQLAQPLLASVRDRLGESASLAVLQDGEALFIARAEAERIVVTGVRVGASLPAWVSATGHVLLGGLPEGQLTRYLSQCRPQQRTPRTPVDPGEIRRRIEAARAEGAAFTDEELELGLRSVAVPVRDQHGAIQAAMSVSAAAARVPMSELRSRFLPVLREHADRLGRML